MANIRMKTRMETHQLTSRQRSFRDDVRHSVSHTLAGALVLKSAVQARLGELSSLRSEVAGTKRYYGDRQCEITPNYDVKDVDSKISGLRTWLFRADAAIKQANATVQIEIEGDVGELLSPIA
jgi:hypothetical protein